MKNSMQPQGLVPKSPDPSHHSWPDLVPVISTIGVDPEIATTTTRLRTFFALRACACRKVVCANIVYCGVLHTMLHEHLIYRNCKH